MANGKGIASVLIAGSMICAVLFSGTLSIQSAHAQQLIIDIFDHEGQPAGQLEVICDNSSNIPGQCGRSQDVLVRYHASEGRDLEIRDDETCPACFSSPARFQSPSGENYLCTDIEYPLLVPAGTALDVSAESCGVPFPLEAGPWAFLSDVVGLNEPVVAFFDVSFFVLPESPIGAIALMGSSLAAFGAFFYFRQMRARPGL
jgi:hypothetical protein